MVEDYLWTAFPGKHRMAPADPQWLIFLREVLSAPTSDADMRIQNTVILVLSVLSTTGAGCIIASFLVSTPSHFTYL